MFLLSWKFWFIVIIVIIFIMWIFWGRKGKYEVVGFRPLLDPDEPLNYAELGISPPPTYSTSFRPQNHQHIQTTAQHIQTTAQHIQTTAQPVKWKWREDRHFKSMGEKIVCKIFEEYLQRDVLVGKRPNFLRNEETGRNLEYDCFDPIEKIAIEYNGEQHYVYPNHCHKTEQEFHDQIYRDELKARLSRDNEIHLIIVPYTVDTCKEDCTSVNGYKKCFNLHPEERERKLKEYLIPILDKITKK